MLTEGAIGPILYRMSIPMMLGIVAILVFNFVDAYYISLLGTDYLAAVSFTFPATFAVMSLILGLGVGNSTLIAVELGAGRTEQAKQFATYSIAACVMIVFSASLLGIICIDPLFSLLGAKESVRALIQDYMHIWYMGVVLLAFPMISNSAMRATGDTRTPSLIMGMSALINGILDPFLIFGIGPFPRLEMQGAALSSAISWCIAAVVAVRALNGKSMLILTRPQWEVVRSCWRRLVTIAMPIVGSNLLNPLALGVITAMVAQFGEAAVAATGVGMRLEQIVIISAMGLSACIPPFVGQNRGARKFHRIGDAMKLSFQFLMTWQCALALIIFVGAPGIAALFSQAEETKSIIQMYLMTLPLSYGFLAWVMIGSALFNGLHSPGKGLLLNASRLFLFYIPFAYLGSELKGVEGLFIGCALANVTAGVLAWAWTRATHKALV